MPLGANIFLTPEGIKLGDFGCAVKLKNHTTLPGEFKNMAGTTGECSKIFNDQKFASYLQYREFCILLNCLIHVAYMAPEVVTSNTQEGHGRAADIWSLGGVVIEMTTGKVKNIQ